MKAQVAFHKIPLIGRNQVTSGKHIGFVRRVSDERKVQSDGKTGPDGII